MPSPWEKYRSPVTIDNDSQQVVSGPWDRYRGAGATPGVGGVAAQPTPVAPQAQAPAQPVSRFSEDLGERTGGDPMGFVTGNINKGIAGLAGLPVDTATAALNLGIAGAGAITSGMPGRPPELIDRPVGGSAWIEDLMRRGRMVTPSAEPESVFGRYGAAALQMLPSAAMVRPSVQQIPRAVSGAVSSGLAGQAGADIGGPEWAGPAAMLPAAGKLARPPTASERATTGRQAERFKTAKGMGIPVPPRELKPDRAQQAIQDTINRELKQPHGTEITLETLRPYRAVHAQDYEAVSNPKKGGIAKINSTPTFQQAIKDIAVEERQLRSEFPNATKDAGLQKVLIDFTKKDFTTKGAMSQIRRLRESAANNISAGGDDKVRMGFVQRKVANALESLIDENLKASGSPDLYQSWTNARTAMAKSYDVEAAIDPATRKINPAKLSAMLTEGAPLSGELRKIAEVSGEFPQAASPPRKSDQYFTEKTSPMAVTHPTAALTHWSTRMWDPLTTSRPAQHFYVDPASRLTPEQQQMLRYLSAATAANRREGEIPEPP